MHQQIKGIINDLKLKQGKVFVRLSAGQDTPLGKIVGRVHYDSKVLDSLTSEEFSGYPHNGGEHTLHLHCKPLDAIEVIEMIKEEALTRLARTEEERQVASELSYISQEIHTLRRKM